MIKNQLYMSYGMLDSLWQVFCYYTMGAMSNDPRRLAYYTGFYKSIQAVGATAISKLDAVSFWLSTVEHLPLPPSVNSSIPFLSSRFFIFPVLVSVEHCTSWKKQEKERKQQLYCSLII